MFVCMYVCPLTSPRVLNATLPKLTWLLSLHGYSVDMVTQLFTGMM